MNTIQVAELKTNFSDILNEVTNNHKEYVIQYGRSHKKVAVLIPYDQYKSERPRIKLGILEKSASYNIHSDFEMTEDELLEDELLG